MTTCEGILSKCSALAVGANKGPGQYGKYWLPVQPLCFFKLSC